MSQDQTTATPAPPLTLDDLKRSPFSRVHFDAAGYWQTTITSRAFRGLVIVDKGPRGRSTRTPRRRQIYYRGELYETLDAVVVAINRERGERDMSWLRSGVAFTASFEGERREFVAIEPLLDRPGWMAQLVGTERRVPSDQLVDLQPIDEVKR